MSAPDAKVSTATLRAARLAADWLGLSWQPLLVKAGLVPEVCEDPDGRLPLDALFALWYELMAHSGDEALGIQLARATPPGTMGIAEYVARNCATLRDVLEHAVRYSRLVNDGVQCTLELDGAEVAFTHTWTNRPDAWPRAYLDWIVGYLARTISRLAGENVRPRRVCLQHGPPADEAAYRDVLGCPVRFSSPVNAIVLDRGVLEAPVQTADPQLRSIMRKYAEEQLGRLPSVEGFLDDVRREVAAQVTAGARLEDVARSMGMSARSLQRRMQDEGTTYQAFVQEVRADLAASYLAEGQMPLGEIAFVLGYSEPSAFHRSFKRSRGVTPLKFRAQARTVA
ncbi:MAG: AraC family transcriptional regulator [Myxococcales bacterium]|nr:AraC family transcriptional regulator [Myxococcales bacterium]MCB9547052.1 AraC family transcriptional regulator [Myxococcales bacterium]